MGPKKVLSARPLIEVRNMIEFKEEFLAKYESGAYVAYLARRGIPLPNNNLFSSLSPPRCLPYTYKSLIKVKLMFIHTLQ